MPRINDGKVRESRLLSRQMIRTKSVNNPVHETILESRSLARRNRYASYDNGKIEVATLELTLPSAK